MTPRLVLVIPLIAPCALARQTFLPLGPFGGSPSTATAIAGSGAVVVGYSNSAAFRWTAGTGMVSLGGLPGFGTYQARAVSADGSVVVGIAINQGQTLYHPFRWVSGQGMTDLFGLGGTFAWAQAVTADGAVVAGASDTAGGPSRATRWTAQAGTVALGTLPGATTSYANGITADGSSIVGSSGAPGWSRAARWDAAGSIQDLDVLAGASFATAIAISDNGNVIVGQSVFGATPDLVRPFRWTAAGGMAPLPLMAGVSYANATALSADGAVVVGTVNPYTFPRAYVWTQQDGMRLIQDILVAAGVNMTGWTLTTAMGITPDGSTIVGAAYGPAPGFPSGVSQGYIVRLSTCYANCDASTLPPILNVQDFSCFLNRFANADTYANCDNSTVVPVLNVQDFSCFLNRFATGCS